MAELSQQLARICQAWNGSLYQEPWFRFFRTLSLLSSIHGIRQNARWLDLGCHQGQFIRLTQLMYGANCTGVDNWEPDVRSDFAWTYQKADIDHSFGLAPGARYEYISALEVIEHMLDTDGFLQRCFTHLEPGGYLLITTPNINSLKNRIRVPLGLYPYSLEFKNDIRHVRIYNLPTLRQHLSEHGFLVQAVAGVNLVPTRFLKYKVLVVLNNCMARLFPTLCSNLIVIAQRPS